MLKSSQESQKIIEEQNTILSTHNILLKDQIETSKSQTQALFEQSQTLRYVVNAISDLPFDAHEIKNKIEKRKSLKK